jgi:hypothetical protein
MGKQKLRVREVVPLDNNPSVIIAAADTICTSKTVYNDLHYRHNPVRTEADLK